MKSARHKSFVPPSVPELKAIVASLNRTVSRAGPHSVLRGLELTAAGLAFLLDTYALPNEKNPKGMCDDVMAFRKHFCDLVLSFPPVQGKK